MTTTIENNTKTITSSDGTTTVSHYYHDLKHSINDQPAMIVYDKHGNIEQLLWFNHGSIHRDNDLPAWLEYWPDGTIAEELWYQNNELHRDTGPSLISYKSDGTVDSVGYFNHDIQLPSEAFVGITANTPEFVFTYEMIRKC